MAHGGPVAEWQSAVRAAFDVTSRLGQLTHLPALLSGSCVVIIVSSMLTFDTGPLTA